MQRKNIVSFVLLFSFLAFGNGSETTKTSPVVISRGVLCVRCNCQQNRSLVGVQSSGSGKEVLQLSLWQSFASGFGSQKQQSGFLLH